MANNFTGTSDQFANQLKGLDKRELENMLLQYQTKNPTAEKSGKYKKWERGQAGSDKMQAVADVIGTVGGGIIGAKTGLGVKEGAMAGGGASKIAGMFLPHEQQRGAMAGLEQTRIDETSQNQERNMKMIAAIQQVLNEKKSTQEALRRMASGIGQGPTIT